MASYGIIPGVEVDKGTDPLVSCPDEVVTEGLDGLRERLKEYYAPDARLVEPEVLMDGSHDIETCYEVTEATLRALFGALYEQNVMLEGTILKASMVVPGKDCEEQASIEEVAEATVMCLKSTVPAILPGIVFLSGGQSDEDATAHLDAMNRLGNLPWPLSFSYGRAMQSAALKLWSQDLTGNFAKAQSIVHARARDNGLAALGKWEG